jgi:hypothetical protein
MGIMSNKVTRRVALGSIAGGLAGTAAVLHVLKGRYNASLPVGEYATGWENHVKMFDIPTTEIEGPATFTLNYRPQVGTKYRAQSLKVAYGRYTYPAVYPQPPLVYSITDGWVSVLPPIVDDLPALSIKTPNQLTQSRRHHKVKPGGEYVTVPRLMDGFVDGLEYFRISQDVPSRLTLGKVSESCADIGAGLTFDYPRGKPLARGTKWTVPDTSEYCVELPCEVVGFVDIAGRKTAKIFAERHLNNQEYYHYLARVMSIEKIIVKERGAGYDVDAFIPEKLKQVKDEECTLTLQFVSYIDLETGLAVRKERKELVQRPKNTSLNQTDMLIGQLLQG